MKPARASSVPSARQGWKTLATLSTRDSPWRRPSTSKWQKHSMNENFQVNTEEQHLHPHRPPKKYFSMILLAEARGCSALAHPKLYLSQILVPWILKVGRKEKNLIRQMDSLWAQQPSRSFITKIVEFRPTKELRSPPPLRSCVQQPCKCLKILSPPRPTRWTLQW